MYVYFSSPCCLYLCGENYILKEYVVISFVLKHVTLDSMTLYVLNRKTRDPTDILFNRHRAIELCRHEH